ERFEIRGKFPERVMASAKKNSVGGASDRYSIQRWLATNIVATSSVQQWRHRSRRQHRVLSETNSQDRSEFSDARVVTKHSSAFKLYPVDASSAAHSGAAQPDFEFHRAANFRKPYCQTGPVRSYTEGHTNHSRDRSGHRFRNR